MEDPFVRRAFASFLLARVLYDAVRPRPASKPRDDGEDDSAAERERARVAAPAPVPGHPAPTPSKPGLHRRTGRSTPTLPPIRTTRLFGISVARMSADEVVERIIAWADRAPARTVITANLDHVKKRRGDSLFRRAYEEADLITADGMPFVWLSEREDEPLPERVAGSDLVEPLMAAAARDRRTVFLFGSTMARLHGAAKALQAKYPTLRFAGAYAPPQGFERDPDLQSELVRLFRIVRPDIILVALGAPKQEIFANGMADSVRHGVFVSIGAGLDVISGDVRRAPKFWRDNGLEWLWQAIVKPLRQAPPYLGLLVSLPGLYAEHRKDRTAYHELRRRRALARLSDEHYRAERARVRAEERAATDDHALDPLSDRH